MGITLIHTSDCVLLSRNDPICVNYPGGSGVCNMRNISLWNWNLQCNTYFQSQQRVTHLESFVLTKIIKYSVLCSIWSIRHSNVVFAPIAMFYVAFLHRGMYAGHGKVLDYVVSSKLLRYVQSDVNKAFKLVVYTHTHTAKTHPSVVGTYKAREHGRMQPLPTVSDWSVKSWNPVSEIYCFTHSDRWEVEMFLWIISVPLIYFF